MKLVYMSLADEADCLTSGRRKRLHVLLFLGLAFELLAGDLAADQAGDGADRCVGAGRIVLAHLMSGRRRKSLVAAPVRFNRHSLNNPMPGKGKGHGSVECQAGEGLAALRAVNRMLWRRKGRGTYRRREGE